MEIHAYDQEYLSDAQSCLGQAFDFALGELHCSNKEFTDFLLNSDVVKQIQTGNPKYISGMNGCELIKCILEQSGIQCTAEDVINLDKSPYYWAGWSLAFYQWYSMYSYEVILTSVPLDQVLNMYDTYHEMDLMQFVDAMDKNIRNVRKEKNLTRIRHYHHMTQKELSDTSGVPEELIKSVESGKESINKISSESLFHLSKSLQCRMEDLMEIGDINRK